MSKLRPWRKDDSNDKPQGSGSSSFRSYRDRDDADSDDWLSSLDRGGRSPASTGNRGVGGGSFGRPSPERSQPGDKDKGGGRFSLRKGGDKSGKPKKEGGGGLFRRNKDKSDKGSNAGLARRPVGGSARSSTDKEKKGGLGRFLPKGGGKKDEPASRSPFIGGGRSDTSPDRLGSPISPNRERLLRSGGSTPSESPGLRRAPFGSADDDDDEEIRPGGLGDRDRSLGGARPTSSFGGARPGSLSDRDRPGVGSRPSALGDRDRAFGGSRPGSLSDRDRAPGAPARPGLSGGSPDRAGMPPRAASRPGAAGGLRTGLPGVDTGGKKDKAKKKEGGKSPLGFLKRGGKDKDAGRQQSRSAARPQEAPARAHKPSAVPRSQSRARPLPETQKKSTLSIDQGLDFDRKIDLIGVMVVAFSLVAFFAVIPSMSFGLLPPPNGGLTGTLDTLLSQLFGWGKIVLPLAGFALGAWLMVQSFAATGIELDYFRIVGMLSLFVCGLSWIHMFELMDDPAPTVEAFRPISYAVAIDDGQGGGWFGHTFYVFLLSQLGDYGTLSVLVAWLVVGLMLTFDVSVVELGRYLVSAFTLVGLSVKRDERAEKRAAREAAKADKMPAARPGEPSVETTSTPRQIPLAAAASAGTRTLSAAPGEDAEDASARPGPRINRRAGGDNGESSELGESSDVTGALTGIAAAGLAAAGAAATGDNGAETESRQPARRRLPHLRRGKAAAEGELLPGESGETDGEKKRFGFLRRRGKEAEGDQPGAAGAGVAPAGQAAGSTSDSGEVQAAVADESGDLPGIPVPPAREGDVPSRPGLGRDPARRERAFGLPPRVRDAGEEAPAREASAGAGDAAPDSAGESGQPAGPPRRGRFLPGARPRPEQPAASEPEAASAAEDSAAPELPGKPDESGEEDAPVRERLGPFGSLRRPDPGERRVPAFSAALDDDDRDEEDESLEAAPQDRDEREPAVPSLAPVTPLVRPGLAGLGAIRVGDEDAERDDERAAAPDRPAPSVMSPLRMRLVEAAAAAAAGAIAGGAGERDDDDKVDHPGPARDAGAALPDEDEDEEPARRPLIGVPRPGALGERRVPPPVVRPPQPTEAASKDETVAAGDASTPALEEEDEGETVAASIPEPARDDQDGEIDTVRADQGATVPQERPGDEKTQPATPPAAPARTLPNARPAQATKVPPAEAEPAPAPVRPRIGTATPRARQAAAPAREAPTPPRQTTTAKQMHFEMPDFRRILRKGAEQDVNDEILLDKARVIEDTLSSFGAPGKVVEVNPGPVITQFGVEPDYLINRSGKKTRVKVGSIARLDADLALALAARSIRIEAPVPGRGFVGIEVPNDDVALVSLYDIMDSPEFKHIDSKLRIALGLAVDGTPVAADLTAMPHLLIAGTTGSGKSVCVNAIIACLLLSNTPDDLQFIMVDPKRVELTGYNGIPHLVAPVVVELERIVGVLQWVQREMDERYRKFAAITARNIEDYNKKIGPGERKMPYYVVVVDELADLMMLAPDETERLLARLAQMARATGIHLIISTQRPSVDIITGLIKANFPARIAFAVASSVDSRVILDQPGAEKLLGRGDMLFQSPDAAAPVRMQGVFVSDDEINRITRYWKALPVDDANAPESRELFKSAPAGTGSARRKSSQPAQRALWDEEQVPGSSGDDGGSDGDDMYEEALDLVQRLGKASISLLQRRLRIGYTRAARLIDMMEAEGIVGPAASGSKPREVLKRKEPDSASSD